MTTYNRAFSLSFSVSGLSTDASKMTPADRKLVEAGLDAAVARLKAAHSEDWILMNLETGWADTIEDEDN